MKHEIKQNKQLNKTCKHKIWKMNIKLILVHILQVGFRQVRNWDVTIGQVAR